MPASRPARSLAVSALEPEAYGVKVLGSAQLGLLSKQSKHRYGLCSSPAADQIGDVVAAKSFVVMYVTADNDDPGLERMRVLGRIVQHDKDESHLGTCKRHLLFKPSPLFAPRLEG